MPHEALQSDEAHLAELGRRLARVRIETNLTHAELAYQAGVGKRTLERLEAGRSIQLAGFLRILRSLDLIDGLERLVPETGPSPMDLLRRQGNQRRRASRRGSRPRPNPLPGAMNHEHGCGSPTLGGKRDDFSLEDFKSCARGVSLKRGRAEAILAEVKAVVSRWRDYADETGVAPEHRDAIQSTLRLKGFA